MTSSAICSSCSTSLEPGDQWCPNCGTRVPRRAADEGAVTDQEGRCPGCAEPVEVGDGWCAACGTRLSSPTSEATTQAGTAPIPAADSSMSQVQAPTMPLLPIGGTIADPTVLTPLSGQVITTGVEAIRTVPNDQSADRDNIPSGSGAERTAKRGWNSTLDLTFCTGCFFQGVEPDQTHCPNCGARFLTPEEVEALEAEEAKTDFDRAREKARSTLSGAGAKVTAARDTLNTASEEAIQAAKNTRAGRNLKDYWVGWTIVGAVLLIGIVTVTMAVGASQNRTATTAPRTTTAPQSFPSQNTPLPAAPVVHSRGVVCPACNGQGHFVPIQCGMCGGTGRFTNQFGDTHTCSLCKGSGFQSQGGRCNVCDGLGHVTEAAAAEWRGAQRQLAKAGETIRDIQRENNRVRTYRCKNCFLVKMMTKDQRYWQNQPSREGTCPKGHTGYQIHEWEEVASP